MSQKVVIFPTVQLQNLMYYVFFRLLSDNGGMDQLADPATEEHLKKV